MRRAAARSRTPKRDGGTQDRKASNGSTKQSACRALPTQKSGVQLTVPILRIPFRHLRPVSKSRFAAGSRHAGTGNRAIPFLWICFLYSTVFAVCKDKKGDSFLNCPRIVIMTLSMCASWHSPECEASGTAASTQPPQCRNPPCCAPRCQARQAAEPKQRSRSHTSFPNRFR